MSQVKKKGAGPRGKKAGGKGPADDKGEDILQAVVSFQLPETLRDGKTTCHREQC